MGNFLKKLFGKNKPVENSFVPEKPDRLTSDEREDFFKAVKAASESKSDEFIFGPDDMSAEHRMAIAKEIIKIKPGQIVQSPMSEADDGGGNDGLVVAEDGAPAGEVFKGSAKSRFDGRYADLIQAYAAINPRILRHYISRAFIGYPACTILGTHEFIGQCCDMPGKNAAAPGYRLICSSSEHKQGDEHIENEAMWLNAMARMADRKGLRDTLTKFSFFTRLYGIGVAIPRVEFKDGHSYSEEYDPSIIKPGSFKGFAVVDPQRFAFDLSDETLYDPLSEYYQKPEFVRLFSREDIQIHRSWCIIVNFVEVGDDLKGAYMWGGAPLSQFLYERFFCADKLANECVALAMSKRTVVKDGNLKSMINDPKNTNHFIERWNGYRNNSAIAFKEPGETIQQLETSLADLQPLSAQQYQYGSAIAGIPVTKLMKNVPSGLQATGEYEQDEYDQTLEDIREHYFRPLMNKWFELEIASSYPDNADLKVEVEFNPLHSPKANEVLQISSQRSSIVCQLLQNHVITVTEGRAILRAGDRSIFSSIAAETPELLKKIEDANDPEKQQQMQMGGQLGGLGGGNGPSREVGGDQPENPEFTENKNIFQGALKEVLGEEGSTEETPNGEVEAGQEQGQKQPEGDQGSEQGAGDGENQQAIFSQALKSLG